MVVDCGRRMSRDKLVRTTVRVVFISLLLDLLAFTIPLPLFPRLVDDFLAKERSSHQTTLLAASLSTVRLFRAKLVAFRHGQNTVSLDYDRKWDTTLLGGALGSIFSFAQFIISPSIGQLSDRFGRKPILLLTMAGNILSALLWLFSTSFDTFLLARLVGGLCEGNVQLAIAIISDVSTPTNRAKFLALVGLAFSIAFIAGPPLGAYFAARPLSTAEEHYSTIFGDVELNIYATPALVTVALLTVETIYLYFALPETTSTASISATKDKENSEDKSKPTASQKDKSSNNKRLPFEQRKKTLDILNFLHFGFLFFFSGCEFSLTFLAYDLFRFTNMQNGKLLGYIGVVSALLQGGYVRRVGRPAKLSRAGIIACSMALFSLALLPQLPSSSAATATSVVEEGHLDIIPQGIVLYLGATLLAFTSATVVNSLNALASLECDEESDETGNNEKEGSKNQLKKGAVLGRFRSNGQLGRAIGPIFATGIYWGFGPSVCYGTSAVALGGLWLWMGRDWDAREREMKAKDVKSE